MTRVLREVPARIVRDPRRLDGAAYGSWRKSLVQMFQEPRNGAALISAHQPRRSNSVGKQNCRQFALLTRQPHPLDQFGNSRVATLAGQQNAVATPGSANGWAIRLMARLLAGLVVSGGRRH